MSGPQSETIDHARHVLTIEAEALQQLANHLPDDFSPLTEAILACSGRVIVSGVGKSGHIGRKISATLASTGTPSYFVHATEASHGDLGMIVDGDLCLLISNSGETAELRDIVAHTRRFSIPMAAISSKAGSTLMKAADFALCLPDAPEACAIGMAPTTSTTMMIALGDALAVALMKKRNFHESCAFSSEQQLRHRPTRSSLWLMWLGPYQWRRPLVHPADKAQNLLLSSRCCQLWKI